jgi:hypothetical protein
MQRFIVIGNVDAEQPEKSLAACVRQCNPIQNKPQNS